MPSECDKCQWNTGRAIPECGQATCDKGERIWMSAHEGLLRIDRIKDDATTDPCPHRLEPDQKTMKVRLNIDITSRFRIVWNTGSDTVDLFLDYGEHFENHHYMGWISSTMTSKNLCWFDKSIIEQVRRLFMNPPPEIEETQAPTRFERITREDE